MQEQEDFPVTMALLDAMEFVCASLNSYLFRIRTIIRILLEQGEPGPIGPRGELGHKGEQGLRGEQVS